MTQSKYIMDMLAGFKPNGPLRSFDSGQLSAMPRVHFKYDETAFSY